MGGCCRSKSLFFFEVGQLARILRTCVDSQGSNYGGQRRAGEEANLTTRAAEPGESGEEKPAMEEQQSEAET